MDTVYVWTIIVQKWNMILVLDLLQYLYPPGIRANQIIHITITKNSNTKTTPWPLFPMCIYIPAGQTGQVI